MAVELDITSVEESHTFFIEPALLGHGEKKSIGKVVNEIHGKREEEEAMEVRGVSFFFRVNRISAGKTLA